MTRLPNGKPINSASDDATNVVIEARLGLEIGSTDQVVRNAYGKALIEIAEGAHKEIENNIRRMREVSILGVNDISDINDLANLQAESDALLTEIDGTALVTTCASQGMRTSAGLSFSFQIGLATGLKNQIAVTMAAMDTNNLWVWKCWWITQS